jgi:outer membrane protein OmpA-like peptidoglycan-associated protein
MTRLLVSTAAAFGLALSAPAWGQATTQDLMTMEMGSLRGEIQQRYDAALARSIDPAIINANDTRYTWATEAKVQCGIALGFLKSSTRDEASISNCAMAASMMDRTATPMAAPVPIAPAPSEVCSQKLPGIVFFEFDSAALPADAQQTIQFVAQNAGPCGWRAFDVVGHTDRAGSDAYNLSLSERRAQAVSAMMTSMGIPGSAVTTSAQGESSPRVPTEDGVRNPQNRRVEIGVR